MRTHRFWMIACRAHVAMLAVLIVMTSAMAPAVRAAEPTDVPPAEAQPSAEPAPTPARSDGVTTTGAPAQALPEEAAATIAEPTSTWISSASSGGTRGVAQSFWFSIQPAPDGGTADFILNGVVDQTLAVQAGAGGGVFYWTPATIGTHSVQIQFNGTASFGPSASEPYSVEVRQPSPDSVVVTSSVDPIPRATDVTFTATVSPNPGPGQVEWRDGAVLFATTDLDGAGVAQTTTSFPVTGFRYITAKFVGNADWSSRTSEQLVVRVVGDEVTLSLTVPNDPMPPGNVVVTAVVTPNPGSGTVRFTPYPYASGIDVPIDADGRAELDLGTLTPQQRTVSATYLGNETYGYATASLVVRVWQTTTVGLTTNRTTAYVGEAPVVLTATTAAPGGSPGGTVTFLDDVGGVVVALGPVTVNSTTGVATLSTSTLRVGSHSIVARYTPPSGWIGSDSAPITVTVAADTAVHATFAPSLATFYPYKEGYRDTVALRGVLGERATVTIKVYSSTGSLKRSWSLGWKNAGAYSVTWNGRTSTGTALAAGKYKIVASFKDVKGHTRNITGYSTISWRKAVWKSASVLRYASTGVYYASEFGGSLYSSPDYPNGRILDSGEMLRDCVDCGWIGGKFVFSLASTALDYRSIYVQIRGHGFVDREHTGSGSIEHPTSGAFALTTPLCLYDQPGVVCGIPVSKSYVSSTKRLTSWVWMTQAWGDAYDLYFVKLTYQYAVWA